MLLELQGGIVYGPVHSRRLGPSLGVNVLPAGVKFCALDCLYCQYGWTGIHDLAPGEGARLPSVDEVVAALSNALRLADPAPAYVTFSGNGEATLHPDFPALVEGVIGARDRLAPRSRTAILSNSTTVSDPRVRAALERLDLRVMKLDAGDAETFASFNRPCAGVSWEAIVEGLSLLGDVTIQALFAGGERGNATPAHVAAWVDTIARIAPVAAQIYTLDRTAPSRLIERLDRGDLMTIARALEAKGIRAQVF